MSPSRIVILAVALLGTGTACTAGQAGLADDAAPSVAASTRLAASPGLDVSHFPTGKTTGIRKDRYLRKQKETSVRQAGALVENVEIHGKLNIEADDVTVRNVRVIGEGDWAVIQRTNASGLVLEDVEIAGDGGTKADTGVLNQGGMITVRRANIHTVSNGIATDHGVIEDSFLHDFAEFPGDHVDGVQISGAPGKGLTLVVRHNTIFNQFAQTSAIIIAQDFGRTHSVLIENNFLAGGGYTVYGGEGKFGVPTDIRIVNNVFSRRFYAKGGFYGPVTYLNVTGKGNAFTGNVWEKTGAPVEP